MTVAVLSVKLKEVSGLVDFVDLDEPLYALAYVWLLFAGAGWLSLDAFLRFLIGLYLGSQDSQAPHNGSTLQTSGSIFVPSTSSLAQRLPVDV